MLLRDLLLALDHDVEISQKSVAQRVDPAVDGQRTTSLPGVLHDAGAADVSDLSDYVQLA